MQGEQEFGIRWDGEYEALSRLIFGLGTGFEDAAAASGLTPDAARALHAKLSPTLFELLFVEAMPIRDAVDLARFLVETTIGFVKFSIARPKTVGGSIAIAAITKHEGFQWVQRQNGSMPAKPSQGGQQRPRQSRPNVSVKLDVGLTLKPCDSPKWQSTISYFLESLWRIKLIPEPMARVTLFCSAW